MMVITMLMMTIVMMMAMMMTMMMVIMTMLELTRHRTSGGTSAVLRETPATSTPRTTRSLLTPTTGTLTWTVT